MLPSRSARMRSVLFVFLLTFGISSKFNSSVFAAVEEYENQPHHDVNDNENDISAGDQQQMSQRRRQRRRREDGEMDISVNGDNTAATSPAMTVLLALKQQRREEAAALQRLSGGSSGIRKKLSEAEISDHDVKITSNDDDNDDMPMIENDVRFLKRRNGQNYRTKFRRKWTTRKQNVGKGKGKGKGKKKRKYKQKGKGKGKGISISIPEKIHVPVQYMKDNTGNNMNCVKKWKRVDSDSSSSIKVQWKTIGQWNDDYDEYFYPGKGKGGKKKASSKGKGGKGKGASSKSSKGKGKGGSKSSSDSSSSTNDDDLYDVLFGGGENPFNDDYYSDGGYWYYENPACSDGAGPKTSPIPFPPILPPINMPTPPTAPTTPTVPTPTVPTTTAPTPNAPTTTAPTLTTTSSTPAASTTTAPTLTTTSSTPAASTTTAPTLTTTSSTPAASTTTAPTPTATPIPTASSTPTVPATTAPTLNVPLPIVPTPTVPTPTDPNQLPTAQPQNMIVGSPTAPPQAFIIPASPQPTADPTSSPTLVPSSKPSRRPSDFPTEYPSDVPSDIPSDIPSYIPTEYPTEVPSDIPTEVPTEFPTEEPTETPTSEPTSYPTPIPTEEPTSMPTMIPTLRIREVCSDGTSFAPLDPENCVEVCPTDGSPYPPNCVNACAAGVNRQVAALIGCTIICPMGGTSEGDPNGCKEQCCKVDRCNDGTLAPSDPETCVVPCPVDGSPKPPNCVTACEEGTSSTVAAITGCTILCPVNGSKGQKGCSEKCCDVERCADGSVAPSNPATCVIPCPEDDTTPRPSNCVETCPKGLNLVVANALGCTLLCPTDGSPGFAGCSEKCCAERERCADGSVAPLNPDTCVIPCPEDSTTPRPSNCVDVCSGNLSPAVGALLGCTVLCPTDGSPGFTGCSEKCCEDRERCADGSVAPSDPDTCVIPCPEDETAPRPSNCVDVCPSTWSPAVGAVLGCTVVCPSDGSPGFAGCSEKCCEDIGVPTAVPSLNIIPTPSLPTPSLPTPSLPTPSLPTPSFPTPSLPSPTAAPAVDIIGTPDIQWPDIQWPHNKRPDFQWPDVPRPEKPTLGKGKGKGNVRYKWKVRGKGKGKGKGRGYVISSSKSSKGKGMGKGGHSSSGSSKGNGKGKGGHSSSGSSKGKGKGKGSSGGLSRDHLRDKYFTLKRKYDDAYYSDDKYHHDGKYYRYHVKSGKGGGISSSRAASYHVLKNKFDDYHYDDYHYDDYHFLHEGNSKGKGKGG